MRIQTLIMYLTFKCNLRCEHCWACSGPEVEEEELPLETILNTVDEARMLGMKAIKLTGGEPFIRKSYIESIADRVKDYGDVGLHIETNGVLLDNDMINLINHNDISLSISLHSSQADKHDQIVGKKGAFDKVVEIIPQIEKKEVLVTLSKKNMDELEEIMELLFSLKVHSVKFNIIQTAGRAEEMEELKRSDMIGIHKRIDDFLKRNPVMSIVTSAPDVYRFIFIKKFLFS